ncbi:MAG: glycosyltransferase [Sphingobacteriales bacterium]|jgi:glycosyltransferase involved in cell wall biosynthesis
MNEKIYDLAIVIHSLKFGGSEKFVLSLSNRFSERGFNVLLVLLERDNPLLIKLDNRIDCFILSRRYKYDISISLEISKILSLKKIKKVLCVEPYAFFLTKIGDLINRKKRNIFLSLHHSKPTLWKKRVLDILFLSISSVQDKVIFICQYQKICFKKYYYFIPFFSHVIYNGIDIDHFSPERTLAELSLEQLSWRKRLGISDTDPVIVIVGRLSPEKGNIYAVEALILLYRMYAMNVHLVFVGQGSNDIRNQLLSTAEDLTIHKLVHFEGAQLDVRPYLLTADLFALTSISETFSLAVLEALSMGLPCSLTDVGGARELITDSRLGDLCTACDPLSIACSWASILKRDNDKEFIRGWTVQHFGEQHMVNEYIHSIGLQN